MPGPVVQGVNGGSAPRPAEPPASPAPEPVKLMPLLAEGTIKLILMSSGATLIARLRHTSDRDGDPAFQLLRPRCVRPASLNATAGSETWQLEPFLEGLTPQQDLVVFKSAVASLLEPQPGLLRHYAEETRQEAPQAISPVERLKKAFQEFTDSIETEGLS